MQSVRFNEEDVLLVNARVRFMFWSPMIRAMFTWVRDGSSGQFMVELDKTGVYDDIDPKDVEDRWREKVGEVDICTFPHWRRVGYIQNKRRRFSVAL